MDPLLREQMLRYYDERAADYEEAYVRGTGTASIADPEIFKAEAARIEEAIKRFGSRWLQQQSGAAAKNAA